MEKVRKALWSLPALAIYFYTAAVLTQSGYLFYFGIPKSFVEASLKENIIFFYEFSIIAQGIASLLSWAIWILLFLSALIIVLLYLYYDFWRSYFTVMGILSLFIILMGFFNYGKFLASAIPEFLVPSPDCSLVKNDARYIVPIVDISGQAVFVPIDQTNKLIGGFFVKNISNESCKLEVQNIGKLTK